MRRKTINWAIAIIIIIALSFIASAQEEGEIDTTVSDSVSYTPDAADSTAQVQKKMTDEQVNAIFIEKINKVQGREDIDLFIEALIFGNQVIEKNEELEAAKVDVYKIEDATKEALEAKYDMLEDSGLIPPGIPRGLRKGVVAGMSGTQKVFSGMGVLVLVVLAVLLGRKIGIGRRQKSGLDPGRDADKVIKVLKNELRKAGIGDMIKVIEAKAQLAKENQRELDSLSLIVNRAKEKLQKFGGAPIKTFNNQTTDDFRRAINHFWKEIGLTNNEMIMLLSLKEEKLQITGFAERLKKISGYNEELAKAVEANIELNDDTVNGLKRLLMTENENMNKIKDFERRIEDILKVKVRMGEES